MGLSRKATKAASPEIAEIKERLLYIADVVCVYDRLCVDVYTNLHSEKYGLGLGPKPQSAFHTVEGTYTLNGKTLPSTREIAAYTARSAELSVLREMGVKNPFETGGMEPLDASNDSDDVKAYKAAILRVITDSVRAGRIKKTFVNRYLPYLGITPLEGQKRYTYTVEVELPPSEPMPITIQYVVDGNTEAEALTLLDRRMDHDALALVHGYRDYATRTVNPHEQDPMRAPVKKGARPVLTETRDLE